MIEEKISAALAHIKERIALAERKYNRPQGSVKLLAVSKTKPVEAINQAIAAGQLVFAENYLQEAKEKLLSLKHPKLEWHYIGSIQSNKTRDISEHFQWVHTIDRFKIARRLAEQRPEHLPPLNICLQINISNEESKSGIDENDTFQLAEQCSTLPNIRLRGLMAMPAPESDFEQQRLPFRKMKALFNSLKAEFPKLDTLSMGTTNDLEAAIAEGATIVRVGTAIFGKRENKINNPH